MAKIYFTLYKGRIETNPKYHGPSCTICGTESDCIRTPLLQGNGAYIHVCANCAAMLYFGHPKRMDEGEYRRRQEAEDDRINSPG